MSYTLKRLKWVMAFALLNLAWGDQDYSVAVPVSLDVIYGRITADVLSHHYRSAQAWCDSLENRNVPHEIVQLKRDWIKQVYSQNHQFGAGLIGGPLLFSQALLGQGANSYGYQDGNYGGVETWFTWNGLQTFSAGFSRLRTSFREIQPDSLWYGVRYTDTLYASLAQTPKTDQFIQGDFTNQFGNADTWYSDYTDTLLGEFKTRPVDTTFNYLVAKAQAPRRPAAVYQNQFRLGWNALFRKWSLGLAVTLGQSNILREKHWVAGWFQEGFSSPWFDYVFQEAVLKLEQATLCQISPKLIRGYSGFLFTLTPTWIGQVAEDPFIRIPNHQFSMDAQASRESSYWFSSLGGAWGPRAYAVTLEGRSVARGDLAHQQSYGMTLGVKPFHSPLLRIYGTYAWEKYAELDRQMVLLGVASQW